MFIQSDCIVSIRKVEPKIKPWEMVSTQDTEAETSTMANIHTRACVHMSVHTHTRTSMRRVLPAPSASPGSKRQEEIGG